MRRTILLRAAADSIGTAAHAAIIGEHRFDPSCLQIRGTERIEFVCGDRGLINNLCR